MTAPGGKKLNFVAQSKGQVPEDGYLNAINPDFINRSHDFTLRQIIHSMVILLKIQVDFHLHPNLHAGNTKGKVLSHEDVMSPFPMASH